MKGYNSETYKERKKALDEFFNGSDEWEINEELDASTGGAFYNEVDFFDDGYCLCEFDITEDTKGYSIDENLIRKVFPDYELKEGKGYFIIKY